MLVPAIGTNPAGIGVGRSIGLVGLGGTNGGRSPQPRVNAVRPRIVNSRFMVRDLRPANMKETSCQVVGLGWEIHGFSMGSDEARPRRPVGRRPQCWRADGQFTRTVTWDDAVVVDGMPMRKRWPSGITS